ncbi:M20 family metallopeptidase [Flavonifractor sp. An100]|uniref:M20 family metallopeptidase n=1 Tax=Flavonifractor sp. An100 TaxID=1965538 RepID=UPI000B3AD8C6|nr:M20 family metallopeptidase [Flavonifractor sp. An100]OUQ77240.1 amidohydrolase [Flavonifractor sp. An100]
MERKQKAFGVIDAHQEELIELSDRIFDHPEIGLQEYQACQWLTDYLERNGFAVERGVGGMETAFRAVYQQGNGGPSFGLLCEYDALEKQGHACGHHLQGPCIIGAAMAIQQAVKDKPYRLVVYGTPAEENYSGKITMIQNGCFQDIDIALMMHMDGATRVDVKSLANIKYSVIFHGVSAHAGRRPEDGKSALDGLLLSFQGIEFMREHVIDDVRMHYTVVDAGGPANVVPARAEGSFVLRSYDVEYLKDVDRRFRNIMQGAALMTDTTVEIKDLGFTHNKIPVLVLNDLLMKNARLVDAPQIAPPRAKTGSTDFSNVMTLVPSSCIRMAFVPITVGPHSQGYYDEGKTKAAHDGMLKGAKILAATMCDILEDPALMDQIKEEFAQNQRDKNYNKYKGDFS